MLCHQKMEDGKLKKVALAEPQNLSQIRKLLLIMLKVSQKIKTRNFLFIGRMVQFKRKEVMVTIHILQRIRNKKCS